MPRLLCTLTGEKFVCKVWQQDTGWVTYTADADVDMDGANGQNGKKAAYRKDNKGSEDLRNAGYPDHPEWYRDIFVMNGSKPLVLPNGVIPSKTAWRFPGRSEDDPAAYLDAATVPYIVVSPLVRQRAKGVILGARARARRKGGEWAEAMVGDIGPTNKIGEVSAALAEQIGIDPDPREGGEDKPVIEYEIEPGRPAIIAGGPYILIPAGAKFV